jgi:hypothetical protein
MFLCGNSFASTRCKREVFIGSFRCPLHHRCGCKAGILILEGPDWMQLDRCGNHNANSHDDDQSKFFKHEQVVDVANEVIAEQQQSAAQLLRNMRICSSQKSRTSILTRFTSAVCIVLYAHTMRDADSRVQLTVTQVEAGGSLQFR